MEWYYKAQLWKNVVRWHLAIRLNECNNECIGSDEQ